MSQSVLLGEGFRAPETGRRLWLNDLHVLVSFIFHRKYSYDMLAILWHH